MGDDRRCRKECAKYGISVQAHRRSQQRGAATQHRPLGKNRDTVTGEREALAQSAVIEALACCGAAQTNDVPAQEPRVIEEFDRELELDLRCVEDDRFLRKPFENRSARGAQTDALSGKRSAGAVTLCRSRRRQLHMRARAGIDVYGQGIAADYATGRMDDDVLAHGAAFRIKRFLHN